MSKKLKNILFPSDCLNHQMLNDYADNKLSAGDKHYVELHLSSCEMCADELEGILLVNDNDKFNNIVNDLNLQIVESVSKKKPEKKRIKPWMLRSAAAVIIFLLISTIIYVGYFKNNVSTNVVTENVLETKDDGGIKQVHEEQKEKSFGDDLTDVIDTREQERKLNGIPEKSNKEASQNDQLKSIEFDLASGETTLDEITLELCDVETEDTEEINIPKVDEKSVDLDADISGKEKGNKGRNYWSDHQEGELYDGWGEDGDRNRAGKDAEKDKIERIEENELATVVEQKNISVSGLFKKRNEAKKVSSKTENLGVAKPDVAANALYDSNDRTEYQSTMDSTITRGGFSNTKVDDDSPISETIAFDTFAPAERGKLSGQTQDAYSIAIAEYNNGNFKTAIEYFEKVLLEDPQNYNALYYAAASYLENNQPQQALVYFDKVLMIQNGAFYDEARFKKSVAYIENDQPAKARIILDEIIEIDNDEYKVKAEELLKEIE